MEAGTMKCPMCGAPAALDAPNCGHCGVKLATATCPSCFGMVFVGSKFCSRCGTVISGPPESGPSPYHCPRCRIGMENFKLGNVNIVKCGTCDGLWVDTTVLQQICVDAERKSATAGIAASAQNSGLRIDPVKYIPCPACRTLMNRVNFGHCSGVIVDVCPAKHGTWFDRDELSRVIEFIASGGMEKARFAQLENLKTEQARLSSARAAGGGFSGGDDMISYHRSSPVTDITYAIVSGIAEVVTKWLTGF